MTRVVGPCAPACSWLAAPGLRALGNRASAAWRARPGRLHHHEPGRQERELREVPVTDQAIRAATPPSQPAPSAIAAELEATHEQ